MKPLAPNLFIVAMEAAYRRRRLKALLVSTGKPDFVAACIEYIPGIRSFGNLLKLAGVQSIELGPGKLHRYFVEEPVW